MPEGVLDPDIIELTSARPIVLSVALYWKDNDSYFQNESKIRRFAKLISDSIERIDQVASVEKRGYRDREIFIEMNPDKLKEYAISFEDIYNAIKGKNINYPGGTVTNKGIEYKIRTSNQFKNTTEIENLILRVNDGGQSVRIKEVANVRDSFEKTNIIEKAFGNNAIILTVRKKQVSDSIITSREIRKIVNALKKETPKGIIVEYLDDRSLSISERLKDLTKNVLIGMGFVIIALFFFLGFRIALMVVYRDTFCIWCHLFINECIWNYIKFNQSLWASHCVGYVG